MDTTHYSHESHYMYMIPQATLAISTSAGYRYDLSILVGLGYVIAAMIMQGIYRFEDNGFLISNSAVFLAASIFMRGYEKLLFVYYLLREKYEHQALDKGLKKSEMMVESGKEHTIV